MANVSPLHGFGLPAVRSQDFDDLSTRAAGVAEGQRRPVTVLFTDVVGSTAVCERIGDEEAFLLMQRLFAAWIAIVHEHKGTVHEFTGDGIVALFGAPVSLEDGPIRACRAAIAIRDHVHRIVAVDGIRPNVRVGIHCGRIVVGKIGADNRGEFTIIGDTSIMAARLEQEAEPGTILISAELQREIAGIAETSFLGERVLKGKSRPSKIYRLDSVRQDAQRFDARLQHGLSRFVGRDAELTSVEHRWKSATGGSLEMVFIVGEAGIGKSRLVHEIRERRRQETAALLQGHCSSDGSATAYLPFVEVIRRAFQIAPHLDGEAVNARLRDGLAALGLPADRHLFVLFNLLGYKADETVPEVEVESIGIRTRETLQQVLIERCHMSPVLLVLEDLHWIDSASQDLLTRIGQLQRGLALLVLCTCRPEYDLSWAVRADMTVIELRALEHEPMLQLLRQRLAAEHVPSAVIESLAEKSEGNPLFGEEMASHLLDRSRIGSGRELPGTAAELLPATIESLLLQRVDQLEEMPRQVVQVASVFGLWFEPDLVAQVIGDTGEVARDLVELEARQLVFGEAGNGRYRFKHALIRDAVYATLLTAERQKLHLAVGEAIERAFANRTGEVADVLAYHFSRTVQTGKAVLYLAMAGDKSLRLYSIDEAHERFNQAIGLLTARRNLVDKNLTAEIVRNAARINFLRGDVFSAIGILEKFLPEVEQLSDKGLHSFYLSELAHACIYSAQADKAEALLDRAQALALEAGNERAMGHVALGRLWHKVFWVEPVGPQRNDVQSVARQALEIGRRHQDIWLMVTATFALALDAVMHGNPREIRRRAELLIDLYRETDDRRAKALSLVVLAELDVFNSDYDQAVERANEAAPWLLTPIDRLNIECIRGMSAAMKGRGEEACGILSTIREKTVGKGVNLTCLLIDPPIGVALVASGELTRGIQWIEETVQRFLTWGFMMGPANGHMFLGEIYTRLALRTDKPPSWRFLVRNVAFLIRTMPFARAKARWHLYRSVELNRRYDAPSYVAWSLLNLGLLEMPQRQFESARQHLYEARRLAESVDAFALLERIDTALGMFPPPALPGSVVVSH